MTTQKKIEANRRNSILGGQAVSAKVHARYEQTPSFCQLCNIQLPFEKKNNRFCSQSHAATFRNTGRQKAQRYKCHHCDNIIVAGKFCSVKCGADHRRRKFTPEEMLLDKRYRKKQISARYMERLRKQTPPDADLDAIRQFYKNRPKGHEVDHIIPISKGGLHTLENLQYLTIRENRRKSNKLDW
jgi:5-methylcytosine-specific restriction endonuclease McrA